MEESTTATTAAPTQASSTNDSEENYNFDSSLSEEERRFYLRAYPTVDLVRERKVHCTICKMHIGTAPCQEEIIRMHPVLRVTHCVKCHEFYNSGEFSKGEDGSELYCRWCGQGGEVYCCSSCPYVFCKSCIVKNLSRGVVVDIEQNENWNCFSCAPKILWPLRAQHWALIRFIEKQKKTIEECQSNESAKKVLYQKDVSTCCRLAKSKCGNMSDSNESLDSATSRRSQSGSSTKKPAKSPAQAPAPKRIKTSNDEVVCTPDLLSMLEPDCQITVQQKTGHTSLPMTSTPKMLSLQTHSSSPSGITLKPHNNTPPPLVLRNTGLPMRHPSPAPIVRRTIIGARNTTNTGHTPVYHTINGYRIDLNSAAQQETFRLPNGKLIQVKRQGTNPTQHNTPSPNNSWMRQASPITIQHAGSGRPVQITPTSSQYYTVQQHQQHQQNSMPHAQMIRCYSNSTLTNVGSQNGGVRGTQIQLINGVPVAPTATPASVTTANATTAVRAPLMVRHVFPDTAIGQARSQLQDQVFNAMEICQHLTGKVQTLTNSNAYKQARNYLEVKELYIHLSYLLTYAIGRFKGLQDKCLGDMRQLGFVNDADSLENGQLAADKQASDDEDNEIEIVEPKTDTITLDSDNEDEAQPSKQTVSPKKPQMQSVATSTISNTPLLRQQCQQSPSISPDNIRQKLILKEHLSLPKGTTIMPAALAPAPKPVPVPVPVPSLVQISTPKSIGTITINKPQDKMEEVDMMTAAKTFLVSLLEVDSDTGEGGSDSTQQQQRKQPRKKTTNKPNPTLLKQKEMLERERLEEMKRNDLKLKMKCAISLKKAEEEYPFAKDMLERHENESKTDAARVVDAAEIDEVVENNENDQKKDMKDGAEIDSTKQDDAANENDGGGDVEILTVDLESSIEEDKENENEMLDGKESPTDKNAEDHSKEFTIVMDDDDDDKEKSLIIEVEGGTNNGEKEPLKVVIDAKTINENSGDKWVANDKTVGVGDKNAKNKLETVSECAKRVIESLQASEKRKEMEKKEISKKEPSGNTVTTTSAPATPATRSSSTELPTDDVTVASVDDTIEPILIDESDVGDSVDSPMKQNKQSCEVANMETTVTEKKQAGTAGYVDMSTTKTTITTTKKDGLIACAIKAATDNENIAELNEPEIDVEKEIEALLMNKSEGPENERNAGADTPSIADAAQTDQTPTAKTDTSVLLSDSVDNLMESESAAALT